MIRAFNIIAALAALAFALGAYQVKAESRVMQAEKRKLERRLGRLQAEIILLKAEWAYLDSPLHLTELARSRAEALSLRPRAPEQLMRLRDIPQAASGPQEAPEQAAQMSGERR